MLGKSATILRSEDGQSFDGIAVGKPSAQGTNSSKRLVKISLSQQETTSLTSNADSLMELMTQKGPTAGMTSKRVSTSPSQADLRRNSSSGTGAFWSTQGHQSVEPDVLLSPILPGQAASDMEWVHSDCHSLQQELDQVRPGQWDMRNGFDPAFDDGLSILDNMSPLRAGYNDDAFRSIQEDQTQNMYHASQPDYVPEPVLRLPNPPAATLKSANAQNRRNRTHSMSEPTALIDQLLGRSMRSLGRC